MSTAQDALKAMGLTTDEVIQVDSNLRTRPAKRDGRVCLCGHGVSKHTIVEVPGRETISSCKPSKMDCPCKKVRPVIDVEDTRPFLRKTMGSGSMHALSRGLAVLAESGKSADWIVDLVCDRCEKKSDSLFPVPVTKDGRIATDATGYDALLCPKCRKET